MKKFYITTPIYYVNDLPHIGHAYTTIAADVLARYYRQKGNVFFITGTDEHGAKIAEAAGKANKTPKAFCDNLVPRFTKTWENLNISYDYFLRTTNKKHEKIVQDLLEKIYKKGDIYKKKYQGLYCVGCEKFLTKSDLVNGRCPDHKKKPMKVSEENYFFRLSKFQKKLVNLVKGDKIKVLPKARKNEILSKLKMGLDDVSISRKEVSWGIPVPWDSEQTIYVWIDALINYYSGPQISPQNQKSPASPELSRGRAKIKNQKFFPADLHLMAKDILWFHAVIWPALCLSAGLGLPKTIFAHGFFTVNGQKMSKTVGNVIDPNDWVKKYGADAVRYYLLSAFPFGEDGDVSEEKLKEKYNNELANELGNLFSRVINLARRFKIKFKYNKNFDIQISQDGQTMKNRVEIATKDLRFNEALGMIWLYIKNENHEIEFLKPWVEKNIQKRNKILQERLNILSLINELIYPYFPETYKKILSQLQTLKPKPLFPRIK